MRPPIHHFYFPTKKTKRGERDERASGLHNVRLDRVPWSPLLRRSRRERLRHRDGRRRATAAMRKMVWARAGPVHLLELRRALAVLGALVIHAPAAHVHARKRGTKEEEEHYSRV